MFSYKSSVILLYRCTRVFVIYYYALKFWDCLEDTTLKRLKLVPRCKYGSREGRWLWWENLSDWHLPAITLHISCQIGSKLIWITAFVPSGRSRNFDVNIVWSVSAIFPFSFKSETHQLHSRHKICSHSVCQLKSGTELYIFVDTFLFNLKILIP